MLKVRATSLQGLKLALWAVLPHNAKREVGSVSGRPCIPFGECVTVWSLSFLNMWWCLTLGEMILPVLH
jgi:hypothetical protein